MNKDEWKTLLESQRQTLELLKELTEGMKELNANFGQLNKLLREMLGKKERSNNYIG